MTPDQAPPIAPFVPVEPDADWETIRVRVMAYLTGAVPQAWSDHNPVDPGVTLAEVVTFGLADLHYRVAERAFDAWPLEVRDWEPEEDRSWHATLPQDSLLAIAAALASPGPTSATELEPLIRACPTPADAIALLARVPWSAAFGLEQRPAVIALMRARLVRQVAQEQAHVIAEAVAAQQRSTGTVAVRDARAAAELAYALPLWAEEIAAVVRRERRRLSQEALLARVAEVRAATAVTAPGIRAALAADDLNPAEVDVAMAAGSQPPGVLPEDLEDAQGRSHIWPPHPIQVLTCEPVTGEDYARLARAHPSVGRAWAVRGRLDGIAWNGLPTDTLPSIAADPGAAAITLVVERVADLAKDPGEFLRAVLRTAIGPEAGAPFPDWRAQLDSLQPRRLICDEIGASLLATAPVLVKGKLITGIGVDRDGMIDDVRARISAFFAQGRPESQAPPPERAVDGPWPLIDQPRGGWIPGDPIRFTEVVEAIVANPDVWGVEELGMKVEGSPVFLTVPDGSLPLPGNAVPTLAAAECLRVRFSLVTECGDA